MRVAPRGTVLRRKYQVERNGFDGPIEVSLADKQARHLQGVTGPTLTLPPGQSEFEYPVFLPPWMEIGRTCRVCVQAVGVVTDGGAGHEVSFSAVTQNDQIITIVETGRLEVAAERSSLVAAPGTTVALPVRVSRARGLAGAARVELVLARHVRGVCAEALVIPADKAEGVLTLRFDAAGVGPFNMPAVVRATIDGPAGPVVGETRLELLPAE
jgi:hypothetical protein